MFCERNFSYKNDPLGKTVGQMIGAARSARQNIVEGSSRAGTSKETELRLYDVAKGSLEELAGDYEAYLAGRGIVPWAASSLEAMRFKALKIDPYGGDLGENARHDYVQYILEMRRRFAAFTEAEDPVAAANAILVMIDRVCSLLSRQIASAGEEFREAGGFTERLSPRWRSVRSRSPRPFRRPALQPASSTRTTSRRARRPTRRLRAAGWRRPT